MVSAIYICHWPDVDDEFSRCELLIHRNYHNSVPSAQTIIDAYCCHYQQLPPHQRTPVLSHLGINYMTFWGEDDIFLLAVSQANCNPMSTVVLLHKFYSNIVHYFEQSVQKLQRAGADHVCTAFSRDSIVDNYSLIYELLDECVDFGVVQVTDFSILKEYIRMEINHALLQSNDGSESDSDSDAEYMMSSSSRRAQKQKKTAQKQKKTRTKHDIKSTHNRAVKTDIVNNSAVDSINSSVVRTQVSAISWRPKGIFYPKNEIYVDIIETCDFLYDLETKEIKANQIHGNCMVRSYLSGMPVCKLGLNEKYISRIEYEDESLQPPTDGADPEDLPDNQLTVEDDPEDKDESSNVVSVNDSSKSEDSLSVNPESCEQKQSPKMDSKKMRVPITNVQFHSCIELSRIYKENLIFFTPPDEEFQLLSYRVEQQKRKTKAPLLLVDPTYRILKSEKKLQVLCSLSTNYKKKLHSQKTIVKIPVDAGLFNISNSHEGNFRFKSEIGEVRFKVDTSEIMWAIGDLPGSKKVVRMMAELALETCDELNSQTILSSLNGIKKDPSASDSDPEPDHATSELDSYYGVAGAAVSSFSRLQKTANTNNHHVSVSFQIPMLTYSGLKVIYLRVDEDTMKYTCFPWVRYVTQAENSQNSGSRQTVGSYRFKLGPSNFTVL